MSWREVHPRKPFKDRVVSAFWTLTVIALALIALCLVGHGVLVELGYEPICTEHGCQDPVR